jgi:hypothetical protein
MAWKFVNSSLGMPPITSTTLLTATVQPKAWKLGDIQRAVDPTFGGGEFIYLTGCASTVAGLLVYYDTYTSLTSLTTTSGALNRGHPVAVAMSANLALYGGWYQIGGAATVLKTAVKVDPALATGTNVHLSATAGRVMQTSVASRQVLGARFASAVTVTSTTSTAVVTLNRPMQQGRIT